MGAPLRPVYESTGFFTRFCDEGPGKISSFDQSIKDLFQEYKTFGNTVYSFYQKRVLYSDEITELQQKLNDLMNKRPAFTCGPSFPNIPIRKRLDADTLFSTYCTAIFSEVDQLSKSPTQERPPPKSSLPIPWNEVFGGAVQSTFARDPRFLDITPRDYDMRTLYALLVVSIIEQQAENDKLVVAGHTTTQKLLEEKEDPPWKLILRNILFLQPYKEMKEESSLYIILTLVESLYADEKKEMRFDKSEKWVTQTHYQIAQTLKEAAISLYNTDLQKNDSKFPMAPRASKKTSDSCETKKEESSSSMEFAGANFSDFLGTLWQSLKDTTGQTKLENQVADQLLDGLWENRNQETTEEDTTIYWKMLAFSQDNENSTESEQAQLHASLLEVQKAIKTRSDRDKWAILTLFESPVTLSLENDLLLFATEENQNIASSLRKAVDLLVPENLKDVTTTT